MKKFLIVAACFVVATAAYAAIARSERSTSMSIDQLLTDFDHAIRTANVSSMERLFLPPDDSANGQNRQSNLRELRKDWKETQSGPPIELDATNAVITLQMTDLDPDGPPTPRVSKIELNLIRTDDGWRIESMR